jgi:hypothetical protein
MGTKLPSGMFNTGYTQPYGSGSAANMYGGGYGGGTYDPMLGFGQSSGMGTTYDYPTRYSADYTRYAQSGQPFNQPVMGYNTYGQIFAQPQRPPPPIMGGGKGGMGGGFGGFRPQPPPMMGGGKGGYDPNRRMQANPGFDTPFGNFPQPRRPERRTNQLGLNQPPASETNIPGGKGGGFDDGYGKFLDFYKRQNNPANSIFEPGSQPPTIGGKGGGGQTDNITARKPSVGFDPEGRSRKPPPVGAVVGPYTGGFGNNVPEPMPGSDREFISYPGGSTPRGGVGQSLPPDISGSPFGPLIGGGLGGMPQQAVNPYQGSYQIPEIPFGSPYQGGPVAAQQGANISDPDRDRAREISMKSMSNAGAITAEEKKFLEDYDAGASARSARSAQAQMAYNMANNPALQNFNFGQGFGRMAFQEGGQVPPDANMEMMMAETAQPEMAGEYDRLIQMTMQAILGQVESPDEVIQMFIDEFGVDAFRQLREAVLKQQVPNAQTEGMVDGNGGGMDDQVMGMIGNQRPVAVSPGEYIVPADVVSGLGDGSSKSGADILDELNQAVRMARTGTPEQPRPLMETLQQ